MTITLYGFAPSTFVRAARLVAEEKGVDYTLQPLDFGGDSHLALHPFGKMPVLDHDGFQLFEAAAIAVYLDENFEGPDLQPANPKARARQWQIISAALHYGYPALVSDLLGDAGAAGADLSKTAPMLDFLNARCGDGLAAGGRPGLADLYVLPMVAFHEKVLGDKTVFAGRQPLNDWFAAMAGRPSFGNTESG